MKRALPSLVSYASSDSESEQDSEPKDPLPPLAKKRKLPALSTTMSVPAPIDDPSKHGGRIRSTPHVDGNYPSHVYVALALVPGSELSGFVDEVFGFAKGLVPALQRIGEGRELHVSLSRATYLRAHQREEVRRGVKGVARACTPFTASFAMFSELVNDEGTRTFLTVEIGAGHLELRALADALTPTLAALRQQEYYTEPRFHASIGWALVSDEMPRFPADLVDSLNQSFASRLAVKSIGSFEVEELRVKIGKDVSKWTLG